MYRSIGMPWHVEMAEALLSEAQAPPRQLRRVNCR
jgi:hypothetical protein